MDKLQTESEKPLLVVRYVWWRVLWRLCIPYIPAIFIFYMAGGAFLKDNNPIVYITMYTFMLFGIGMTINLLLTRDFRFFNDRIERRWFLFGMKIVKYNEITVVLTYTNMKLFSFRTFAFDKKIKCFHFVISLDRNLISKTMEQTIIQLLANISHRGITELQENIALDPFLKCGDIQPIDMKKCWWLKPIW